MKAWENYAMIVDGRVKEICSFSNGGYSDAQIFAKDIHGKDAFAINVTYIPVRIADEYVNGIFQRDGQIVQPYPTEEEQLELQSAAIDDLAIAILEG